MTDTARHQAASPVSPSSEQAQAPAGTAFLMPEHAGPLTTAAREINAHVNDHGQGHARETASPRPRAELAEFTPGSLAPAAAPRTVPPAAPPRKYDRAFPARPSQVGEARKYLAAALDGCPVAEDAILCLSELASNSVLHSNSKKTGGTFTVRAEVRDGDYLWLEVEDNGGPWEERARRDDCSHGLDIIRALAADCGRDGDAHTGWVMWVRLDWPVPASRHQPVPPAPQRR